MSWKVSTREEHVSLINSKPFWNCCMTWKFIRKYRCLIVESWKRWWRETWVRNFDCEILTPEIRGLRQVQWLRVAGDSGLDRGQGGCYQWKAKEQCPRGDKCSVVLISRLFSVEHAIVGNEARAERIKFSIVLLMIGVLMIGVFPFFFIDYTIVRSGIQSIFLELTLARRTAITSQTCATVVSQIRSLCPWRRRASSNISLHKRLWRDVFVLEWTKFQPAHTDGTAEPRTSRIQELCRSLLGICFHQTISFWKESSGLWPDQFLSTESGYSCSHLFFWLWVLASVGIITWVALCFTHVSGWTNIVL